MSEENVLDLNEPSEVETEDIESSDENETKAEKFIRIGQVRVTKAIESVSRLENLSGSSYEYTEEQVEKMFGAIQQALDDAKAKFNKKKEKEKKSFTF